MEDEPRLGIVTRSIYSYSTHNGTEHVRRLEEGTEVQIIGKSGIWLQIGENEWVSSNSVYDTFATISTTSLGTVYVKNDTQGYSYPGTAYSKTATILAGTQTEYYAKCGNWYLVAASGKNVWVRGNNVTVSRAGIVTATCRSYKTPEISVNIVNSYSEGARVVLLGEQNGWYQLPDGGWISKELVYDTTLADPSSSERIGSGVTLAYGGYVYTAPSGESQKISYLTAGKTRNLYRQSGNWYEIYTNGQFAWVRASDYNVTTSVQRGRLSQGYLLADINTSLGPGEEYMNSTVTLACGTLSNVYEIRNGWYKVYRQGVYSWVDGQYFYDLSTGKDPGVKMGSAVMTADAQVYEAPYPSAAKLGTVKTGLRRNVYLRCGDWVQIYNGGRYCWIYAKDMKMDLSVGKKTGVALVLYESNLRTGPGKGFMVKGTAKAHSTVNIYGTWGEWYLTYRMGEYLWINAMQVSSPRALTN